jgi:hypothetical protein
MVARARLRALVTDSTRVEHPGHLRGAEAEYVAEDEDGALPAGSSCSAVTNASEMAR